MPLSPLEQAFLHFPGIGPVKAEWLEDDGIRRWSDLLEKKPPQRLEKLWPDLQEFARQNLDALTRKDLNFFIEHLDCGDRWRLVHEAWPLCHFLDIETTGLEMDDAITIISVWNGSELRLFVKDENLEDFPDYLLSIPLAVTFNGSTFDLPVIKRYFNLPDFPVPHIDMRWICHRCQLDGGLKAIERELQLPRPQDLQGVDGMEAVLLWHQWEETRNPSLRSKLLRYCAADTIALQHVAAALLRRQTGDVSRFAVTPQDHWDLLQQQVPFIPDTTPKALPTRHAATSSTPLFHTINTPAELRHRLRDFLARKRATH